MSKEKTAFHWLIEVGSNLTDDQFVTLTLALGEALKEQKTEEVAKAEAKEAKAKHDAEIAAINHGDPYISIADMEELWAECGNFPFLGLSIGDHVWFTEGDEVEYEVVEGSKGVTVASVKAGAPPPFPVAYNITEAIHPLGVAQLDISRIVYGVGDR